MLYNTIHCNGMECNRAAKKKKIKEEHKLRQANPFRGQENEQNQRWAWAEEVKPGAERTFKFMYPYLELPRLPDSSYDVLYTAGATVEGGLITPLQLCSRQVIPTLFAA